jgi:hypothetical protein
VRFHSCVSLHDLEVAVLEMFKRANLDFCARCGGELGYDVPISNWGARTYHPECLTKMLSQ